MKTTPRKARVYFLAAAFLIALPSLLSLYKGDTGKFLVATALTRGTPFEHSVIYLTHHGLEGASGVIINQPIDRKVLLEAGSEGSWKANFYFGGPVSFGKANAVLIRDKDKNAHPTIAAVDMLRRERPDIAGILDSRGNEKKVIVFSGYAGWMPLQLNKEIARGAWAVIDYDPALMYETPPGQIWNKAMEKVLRIRPAAKDGV